MRNILGLTGAFGIMLFLISWGLMLIGDAEKWWR